MYWILFVMGTIVAVVSAVIVGGLASPRAYTVTSTARIDASIDAVWHAVREVGAYSSWRTGMTGSSATLSAEGAEWTEHRRGRSVRFGVTTDEAPHRFGARVLDDDLSFTGEWAWTVAAEGSGTRVTITEHGEIGNPIARFVATHMRGHGASIELYLADLATRFSGVRDFKGSGSRG